MSPTLSVDFPTNNKCSGGYSLRQFVDSALEYIIHKRLIIKIIYAKCMFDQI